MPEATKLTSVVMEGKGLPVKKSTHHLNKWLCEVNNKNIESHLS